MTTKTMQCADCNLTEHAFTDAGDGDWAGTCGWLQRSTAGGCAELCRLATWHSLTDYARYAAIAREGGYDVPDAPAHGVTP